MTKIYLGKICNYFGINGELKVISDFDRKDLIFKEGFKLYLDNDEELLITGIRNHKNYELIKVNNLNSLNEVNQYIDLNLYFKREDVVLKKGDYLMEDLLNFKVKDEHGYLGTIIDIIFEKYYYLLKVKDKNIFYLPFVDEYIEKVDLDKQELLIKNGEGLKL